MVGGLAAGLCGAVYADKRLKEISECLTTCSRRSSSLYSTPGSGKVGLEVSQVTGDEDEFEASKLVVDESCAYGGRFVPTKDGFAVEAAEVTEI